MPVSREEKFRSVYQVNRLTYSEQDFVNEFHEIPSERLTVSSLKSALLSARLETFGFKLFPFIQSIRSFYNWHNFLLDIIAGVTMVFLHLPQGMAYGVLAGLKPVNGLYTSFFPVVAYFFFTTSRHNSIGTFSLASLLFSDPINRITTIYFPSVNVNRSSVMNPDEYDFRLQLSTTLTFSVGIFHMVMALLQVGFLVTYLSGPLISGFMCASAFHVVASQLSAAFGLDLPRICGLFNLPRKVFAVFANIHHSNIATVIIFLVCLSILYIVGIFINPPLRRKFKVPIPAELIIVIASTVISHFSGFSDRYSVQVVGEIPVGLPVPAAPTFAYFTDLISDVFVIGLVTFAINAGLVKTYAMDFGYEVSDNQELLALGISNLFGSFFQCHAACGALGRTAVVVTIGMASQIASLISCALFLVIFFVIAPYMEALPKAVLSAIVFVALTSTFKKVRDFKRLWTVSRIDASIWLVAFLTTLIAGIPYGLVVGFGYSILTVVSRSQNGGRFLLGSALDTGLYSELKRFEKLHEKSGIKIIRYDGPVYFANAESFRQTVYRLSGVNPTKAIIINPKGKRLVRERKNCGILSCPIKSQVDSSKAVSKSLEAEEHEIELTSPAFGEIPNSEDVAGILVPPLRFIVLDASGWQFTDTVGLRVIKEIIKHYIAVDVTIFVAGLRPRLRCFFQKSGVYNILHEDNFFMSVHDAVLVASVELQIQESPSKDREGCDPEVNSRRRRLTLEDVEFITKTDPDVLTDLSVVGEEHAFLM